ncbi:quinone oxidoreductase family protein [Streptomyces rimosus]|uniref:quinone oxidoreductase family protein n=1 Tax=Streptomyces rimosus TaxID=1927 RepID=UPI0004C214DC|nr:zinc-binding dehydrogenase [Streptomyces rimosus]
MRAIVMQQSGGPEVLEVAEVPEPEPRGGHHLVEVAKAGVNFADIHYREDSYLAPVKFPAIPGQELVGRTRDGRRVVALCQGGAYAEVALTHRRTTWEIPENVSDDQAVALALQGNSAYHLLITTLGLEPGDSVLIPAAAGGVGSLAVQIAKLEGAKVVAMASSEEKRTLARELGADAVVDSSFTDGLAERIVAANGGPVKKALEMTGGATFDATLDALAPRGRMAVFGCASGERPSVPVEALTQGSKGVFGFWLPNLYADRYALRDSMAKLFTATASGHIQPVTSTSYALEDARTAHADLAARRTTGKVTITPTR